VPFESLADAWDRMPAEILGELRYLHARWQDCLKWGPQVAQEPRLGNYYESALTIASEEGGEARRHVFGKASCRLGTMSVSVIVVAMRSSSARRAISAALVVVEQVLSCDESFGIHPVTAFSKLRGTV
jgi:hypothetical protein